MAGKDLPPNPGAQIFCEVHAFGEQRCPAHRAGADIVFPRDALTGLFSDLGNLLVFTLICSL